jgi:hypothetical protein
MNGGIKTMEDGLDINDTVAAESLPESFRISQLSNGEENIRKYRNKLPPIIAY